MRKNLLTFNILVFVPIIFSSCEYNPDYRLKTHSETYYDDAGNLDYHVLTESNDSLLLYYFPGKIIKEIKYYYFDTIVYYKKFNVSGDIKESIIKPSFEIIDDELVVSLRYLYYDKSSIGIMFGDNPHLKTLDEIKFSAQMTKSISIPLSEIPQYQDDKIKGRVIELYPPTAVLGFYDFDMRISHIP